MEPARQPDAASQSRENLGFGHSRGWWLVLLVLTGWHGFLTLALFDEPGSYQFLGLWDDNPIVCGRHALHLYHGYLGAQELLRRGGAMVYDPAYDLGYPKTPWFDAGSRPAELFLLLAGAEYSPRAYKLGVAAVWGLLPLAAALAAGLAGSNRGVAVFAALAAILLCWSDCGRNLLWRGEVDWLLASALGLLGLSLGMRYHQRGTVAVWLGLTLCWTACLFCQGLVVVALLPAGLAYYGTAGGQHRVLWHLGLVGTAAAALAANAFWLRQLGASWWIPSWGEAGPLLPSPWTVTDALRQNAWILEPMTASLVGVLGLAALAGAICWYRRGDAVAAGVWGVAAAGPFLVAVWGMGTAAGDPGSTRGDCYLFLAVLAATTLAAQAVAALFDAVAAATGTRVRAAAVLAAGLAAVVLAAHGPLWAFLKHSFRLERLPVGLSPEVQALCQTLMQRTTGAGRILWEESPASDAYSPLLGRMTGRQFVGGLGPDARIEHSTTRLREGLLGGRPLEQWTDLELADFARRFNLGWIVCRSAAARKRLQRWSVVESVLPLADEAVLLTLRRPLSYALVGKAQVIQAEPNLLTLAEVVPSDGVVVLSFHHHPCMVPSVDRVRVEREPHLYDGIPLLRLRLTAPLTRLSLRCDP